jgi:hypothetical protein
VEQAQDLIRVRDLRAILEARTHGVRLEMACDEDLRAVELVELMFRETCRKGIMVLLRHELRPI